VRCHDYYGQQSCTAGRAAFIGPESFRTGPFEGGSLPPNRHDRIRTRRSPSCSKPLGYARGRDRQEQEEPSRRFATSICDGSRLRRGSTDLTTLNARKSPTTTSIRRIRVSSGLAANISGRQGNRSRRFRTSIRAGAGRQAEHRDGGPIPAPTAWDDGPRTKMEDVDADSFAGRLDLSNGRLAPRTPPFFSLDTNAPHAAPLWTHLSPEWDAQRSGLACSPTRCGWTGRKSGRSRQARRTSVMPRTPSSCFTQRKTEAEGHGPDGGNTVPRGVRRAARRGRSRALVAKCRRHRNRHHRQTR